MEADQMKERPFPLVVEYRFGWLLFWLLCMVLVYALTISMTDSIRDLDADWLIFFGIAAIFLGWFTGGSMRRNWLLFILGILSGMSTLVLVKSNAIRLILQALNRAFGLNVPYNIGLDRNSYLAPVFYYLYAALDRLWHYIWEAALWLTNLPQTWGEYSAVAAGLIWGGIFWAALFTTGWLFRKKAHAVITGLPVLILSAGILGYSRQDTLGLILTLSSLLMLTILTEQLKREMRWQDNLIDFSEEIRFDTAMIALPVIALILTVSISIPNISVEKIRDFFNDLMGYETNIESNLPESLGIEQLPMESAHNESHGGMPQSHLIGTGPELSSITVMEINADEVFLPPQIDVDSKLPQYYWFGRSYNLYTGTGWKTSPIYKDDIPAGEVIHPSPDKYYQLKTVNIKKKKKASDTFYIPGIPNKVDHRIKAGWLEANDEYFSAQLDAREYQVTASILYLSEDLLQDINETPPDNIMDTYLQIPEELPNRVFELAQSITSGLETPYEKSKAIESYLRQYEYSLELPPPPTDRDIVDYFLFDLQRGYCDYTSSAMVILARASGLPARLAVGYATGSYDYTRNVFIVTEAHAHAWPEIYIEPFGWVPFEPTASLTPFSWEGYSEEEGQFQPSITDESMGNDQTPLILNVLGVIGMILVVSAFGYLWYWLNHRKERQKTNIHKIERLYQRLETLFSTLFFSSGKSRTAQEYRDDVISYLEQHSNKRYTNRLADRINHNLSNIIKLYQYGIYAPQPLQSSQVRQARKDWFRLIFYSGLLRILLTFE